MGYFRDAFVTAFKLLYSFDPEIYGIIFLSLKISVISVIISGVIGIPLGSLISFKKFIGKSLVINIVNTFMGVPPVLIGLVVYILLSNQFGIFGSLRLLFTQTAMVIAQVMLAVPIVCGLTISAIHETDSIIHKTAVSLGATPIQSAFTVIKEARYGIMSSIIVAFGRLMGEVGAVMMVGGNVRYQTRVMTTAIAMHKGMGEFEQALALGIILLMLSFIINFGIDYFRSRNGGSN
jgi:tungstate transport system permease protein